MEGVDADYYVLEHMVRDRLINARARARVAALIAEAAGSPGPGAVTTRFRNLRRQLVNGVRNAVREISHALPGRTGIAK